VQEKVSFKSVYEVHELVNVEIKQSLDTLRTKAEAQDIEIKSLETETKSINKTISSLKNQREAFVVASDQ